MYTIIKRELFEKNYVRNKNDKLFHGLFIYEILPFINEIVLKNNRKLSKHSLLSFDNGCLRINSRCNFITEYEKHKIYKVNNVYYNFDLIGYSIRILKNGSILSSSQLLRELYKECGFIDKGQSYISMAYSIKQYIYTTWNQIEQENTYKNIQELIERIHKYNRLYSSNIIACMDVTFDSNSDFLTYLEIYIEDTISDENKLYLLQNGFTIEKFKEVSTLYPQSDIINSIKYDDLEDITQLCKFKNVLIEEIDNIFYILIFPEENNLNGYINLEKCLRRMDTTGDYTYYALKENI